MSDRGVPPPPKVGDDIYVDSSFYLSHGRDDFVGGLVRVTAVITDDINGRPSYWIEIEERPGTRYNWDALALKQAKLRAEFGDSRGFSDPDNRREFNEP
jgi:hypothetical protein